MVIYSGTICNSVLYFFKSPVNVLSYFHNLKNKKEEIHFLFGVKTTRDFPGDVVVKNLPTKAGHARDMIQSLGREDSPGVGNGNPLWYSCLKIPWTEEPGGLQSMGSQRVGHD